MFTQGPELLNKYVGESTAQTGLWTAWNRESRSGVLHAVEPTRVGSREICTEHQVGACCSACVPASQKLFSLRAAELRLQLMQLWHRSSATEGVIFFDELDALVPRRREHEIE